MNRNDLLNPKKKDTDDENDVTRQLTFTVNRDQIMSKKIKAILHENQADIDKLLGGPTRLIVAERKNNSTASLVLQNHHSLSVLLVCLVTRSVVRMAA